MSPSASGSRSSDPKGLGTPDQLALTPADLRVGHLRIERAVACLEHQLFEAASDSLVDAPTSPIRVRYFVAWYEPPEFVLAGVVELFDPSGQRLAGAAMVVANIEPHQLPEHERPWQDLGVEYCRVPDVGSGHADHEVGVVQSLGRDHPTAVRGEVDTAALHDLDGFGGWGPAVHLETGGTNVEIGARPLGALAHQRRGHWRATQVAGAEEENAGKSFDGADCRTAPR
jgi:hypothetical protein